MDIDERMENKAEDLEDKAKQATGKATGDEELEVEGKTDQTKADPGTPWRTSCTRSAEHRPLGFSKSHGV